MNILSLETSQPQASLCLISEGEVKCDLSWEAARNHDEWLFPALQKALDCIPADETLHFILVGAGPGSYGGVRVSLAAAVGIAAVTGARVVALCSWNGLADNNVGIVSDAKRGGWTLRRPNGEIVILTPEELINEEQNGMLLATIEQPKKVEQLGISWIASGLNPTAKKLYQQWVSMSSEEQQIAMNKPAEPIYVRPPHITKALHKPWEIKK